MIQEMVEVLWNEKVGDVYYRIGLASNEAYLNAEPGQFVMVRLMEPKDTLLRRPFSIHRLISPNSGFGGIELLYKVVGSCTERLSQLDRGDRLDVLGPLGKGFEISLKDSRITLVAGGIGVAPLVFLSLSLRQAGISPDKCSVYLGAKSKMDLLCKDVFIDLGMALHVTTDDGSDGQACLVTHPLEAAVKENPPDRIYACGPVDMLKCVQKIAQTYAVPCQMSIEAMMACGIGACLGCAVETHEVMDVYRHVCMDGPVFDASILKI